MTVLALTTSLLTDRMLRYSRFADVLRDASEDLHIWARSSSDWNDLAVTAEAFPAVNEFRGIPHNRLRRLNEATWDRAKPVASRTSMARHSSDRRRMYRSVRLPAWLLAHLRMEEHLEASVERMLVGYERSPEATERLARLRPDAVLSTSPFRLDEPGVTASAKRLQLPTMALITSWDNLSTKNRMPIHHAAYAVWSDSMREELLERYPHACAVPVHVVGAPQFDVFFDPRWRLTRDDFVREQGLDPSRPVVLYALGSPNFLHELPGALDFARRVDAGRLGDAQLLVRPHPVFEDGAVAEAFRGFSRRVVVQDTAPTGSVISKRSQSPEQVVEWVNTFLHSDVVVNLSSTVAIDAALMDTPVVNLDYDPSPGGRQDALIKEINAVWPHFSSVVRTGALTMTRSADETEAAVRTYLADPALHRAERQKAVELVCGPCDGRSGERLATALLDVARSRSGAFA